MATSKALMPPATCFVTSSNSPSTVVNLPPKVPEVTSKSNSGIESVAVSAYSHTERDHRVVSTDTSMICK